MAIESMLAFRPMRSRANGCCLRLSLLLGLFLVAPSAFSASVGYVQSMRGEANILDSNAAPRVALKGAQVFEGNILETYQSSTLQLRLTDGAVLYLSPNTRLLVEKFHYAKRPSADNVARLFLETGAVRVQTGQLVQVNPGRFLLTSNNAAINVKGADFEMVYLGQPQSSVSSTAPSLSPSPIASLGTYVCAYTGSQGISAGKDYLTLAPRESVFVGSRTDSQAPQPIKLDKSFLCSTPLAPSFVKPSAPAMVINANPQPLAPVQADRRAPQNFQISVRFDARANHNAVEEVSTRAGARERVEQQLWVKDGEKASFYDSLRPTVPTPQVTQPWGYGVVSPPPIAPGEVVMVTPHWQGQRVTLEIQTQQNLPDISGAQTQSTKLNTTVSVTLGQWQELSAHFNGAARSSGSESVSTREVRDPPRSIWVRVDATR